MKKLLYIYCLLHFCNVYSISNSNLYDPIVKGCTEQVNHLIEMNSHNNSIGRSDSNWYIYFIGKDKKYLKSYLSYNENRPNNEFENILTKDVEIDREYLKRLNNNLIEINKSEKLEVYVAFIGSEQEIIQPLMPKKINTFHKGRVFLDSLINYSVKNYKDLDLEQAKEETEKYSKDFSDAMHDIYKNSEMAKKSNKPNHIMPFSHRTIRHIYNKEGEKETKQKWAISIYKGKQEKRFNKLAFRDIYKKEAGFGKDPLYQKISRQVLALQKYFSIDIPSSDEYREDCTALLTLPRYQPLLESRILAPVLRRNPCILKNMGEMGPIDYSKSEWMETLETLITTPLYVAILAPVAAELFIPSLIEAIGTERATNATSAMAIATVIEVMTIHYWSGTAEQQEDLGKAILGVNKVDVAYEGVKGLASAPFLIELSVDCIYEGTKLADGIINPDTYKFDFDTIECVSAVGMGVLTKIGLNQSGQFFKTLKRIAKEDPDKFIKGWARVWKDIKVDQKDSFIDMSYGIFKELGIPSHKIDGVVNKLKLEIEKLKNDVTNSNSDEIITNDVVEDTPNNQGNSIDSATVLEGWKSVLGKRIEDVVDAPKGYEFYVGATGKKLIRKIRGSDAPSLSAKDGTIRYAKGLQGLLEDEFQNIFKEYSGWDTVWKKKFLKDFDNQWSMLDHLNKNKDLIDGWKNFRHKYGNEIICTK